MDDALKRRLTGAVVLVSLAVIFVPMMVEDEPVLSPRIRDSNIPVRPPSVMIDPDSRRPAVTESAPAPADPTPALPAPEVMTPPEENAQPPVMTDAPKPEEPIAEPVQTPAEPKVVEKTVQEPEPPPPPPAPKPPAAEKSDVKKPTGWVVQVGSFADKDNAEKTLAKLRLNGYDSFVEEVRVGSKSLYRVRVGPEVKKERAESLNTQIANSLKLKGQVQRYP